MKAILLLGFLIALSEAVRLNAGEIYPPCSGTPRFRDGLNITSQPDPNATILGHIPFPTDFNMTGRATGTPVIGNPYWFRVGERGNEGYVSAYRTEIIFFGDVSWCVRT